MFHCNSSTGRGQVHGSLFVVLFKIAFLITTTCSLLGIELSSRWVVITDTSS